MKVVIEVESQAEFDEKRPFLAKALLGTDHECVIKARPKTIYRDEKPALAERRSPIKAQQQILAHWDGEFSKMIAAIKEDIEHVLRSGN